MEDLPQPLKQRFLDGLARLWPEGGRLGIAVSGGPDSLALLALAHASFPPGQFEAATVDHGLRPESASEAAMVARLCEAWSVPHETLNVTVSSGNVQSSARSTRYAALAEWARRRGFAAIATAHHADDQAETLIMRLNRASGLSGLAGVRARGHVPGSALPLIRPVLDWRRGELAAILTQAGIEAAQDPSNSNPRFDRVRIRQHLADCEWLDVPALAQSAAHLADAQAALEWAVQREWQEAVAVDADELRYLPSAPRAIRLSILARALQHFGGAARGGELARLADALEGGRGGTLGGVLARAAGEEWVFTREGPRAAG